MIKSCCCSGAGTTGRATAFIAGGSTSTWPAARVCQTSESPARDAATLPTGTATDLCGPAGTVVLLHCRVVHGSAVNYSSRMRPLLLNVYASADTLPITPAPTPTSHTGVLVRGQEPTHVHMEPYRAKLPPRWDQVGYRSIFSAQAGYD
jgi:hypothetical protein